MWGDEEEIEEANEDHEETKPDGGASAVSGDVAVNEADKESIFCSLELSRRSTLSQN